MEYKSVQWGSCIRSYMHACMSQLIAITICICMQAIQLRHYSFIQLMYAQAVQLASQLFSFSVQYTQLEGQLAVQEYIYRYMLQLQLYARTGIQLVIVITYTVAMHESVCIQLQLYWQLCMHGRYSQMMIVQLQLQIYYSRQWLVVKILRMAP